MTDSTRFIRMYRFNPNEGLYEAIAGGTYSEMQLPSFAPEKLDTMPQPALQEKTCKPTVSQPKSEQCASCFKLIEKGIFFNSQKSQLFFCDSCGLEPPEFNYYYVVILLLAAHLFGGMWLESQ